MKKYAGVLKRVREMEEKRGIKYANTDGKLYKTLKVLCIISAVWGMVFNLLFVLSFVLMYSGTDILKGVLAEIITVSVCTALVILSLVLNKFKVYIVSAALNVFSSVFVILLFGNLLKDGLGFLGFKISFYYRHFAPFALMVIFMVWLTVIAVRAKIKTDRMYKKVTENLYNMYRVSDLEADIMSDDKWDEFLQNYDPCGTPVAPVENTENTENAE